MGAPVERALGAVWTAALVNQAQMSENVRRSGGLAVGLAQEGGEIGVEILGWALAFGGALATAAGVAGLAAGRIPLLRVRARMHAIAYLLAGLGGLVVGAVLLSAPVPPIDQALGSLAPPTVLTEPGPGNEDEEAERSFHESSAEGMSLMMASGVTMVPPRVLSSELYPCTECHADDGGEHFLDRDVDFHEDKAISGHGEPLKWCFDCHNPENPDTLRLVGGEAIEFENLDVLCGQCHGKIYAAWKAGAYGKRVGSWNGEKRYFSCTECHDPHQPRFEAIRPDPAPVRPEETLR